MHKVGDVLTDGREIVAVDDSLKRYGDNGELIAIGVEYSYTHPDALTADGELSVRKFQNWQEV